MKRTVWADPEVRNIVNSHFIPVMIDVNNPEESAILTNFNVAGPPVTIVTDSSGNALDWRAGGLGKSEFLDFLSDSL